MASEDKLPDPPRALLARSLASERLHSAYLLSGPGEEPRRAAEAFVRTLVCSAGGLEPCEACPACRRSSEREPIAIDGTGKRGPLLRHVGDHPDLFWIERGEADTRVRIGQIRALQRALRLRAEGEGRRAAVIADAEWLNVEAQNALLRVLEEPPPNTTLVLVASSPASLLATVRSRCQRVVFPAPPEDLLADPERSELVDRIGRLGSTHTPDLLDWAAEYRGARADAAVEVHRLLETGAAWLHRRVIERIREPGCDVRRELDANHELSDCRKVLDQRNANPQMVAERALLALQGAIR